MSDDFYGLLGVSPEASDDEIKRAFRKGARELHPDVNKSPGAEEQFKELARAYEVLSDPDKRAKYDRYGAEGLGGHSSPDFADFSTFEQLFDTFFGGSGGGDFDFKTTSGPAAGQDHVVDVQISFLDAVRGITSDIEVDLVAPCDRCGGSGAADEAELSTCETCVGSGHVEQVQRTVLGQVVRRTSCPQCQGTGQTPSERCSKCLGKGRHSAMQSVEVAIPAGIEHGQRIVMRGRGHAGAAGVPSGDLYVQVGVSPDERFVRDGLDIVSSVTVSVTDAIAGTKLSVPTASGDETITIAPGTQPHEEIVLQGKGFPALDGRAKGDQRVIVEVLIPRADTPAAQEALATLAEALTEGSYGRQEHDDGLLGRLRHAFR